jgi:hypothetical protein
MKGVSSVLEIDDWVLGALGFQIGRLCGRVPAGLVSEMEAAVLWSSCGWLAAQLDVWFGIWRS